MNFYRLHTTVHHPAAMVDIADAKHQVFDYFLGGVGDGRFLERAAPRATAQVGYTRVNIESTDYLECSIGVPIFSRRLVDALGASLRQDVEVHHCIVRCQGEDREFYLGRITRTVPGLVDVGRSSFRTLSDGRRALRKAVYNTELTEPFFLARDPDYRSAFVASEALKSLVEASDLKVGFMAA